MATSASTYGTSPFHPMARGGAPAAQQGYRMLGSQGPDSVGLTKAMSLVMIQDSCSRPCFEQQQQQQHQAMSQDSPNACRQPQFQWNSQPANTQGTTQGQPSCSQGQPSFSHALPRRLALELSQTHSQELPLCTPDFATPGEPQQFMVDYEGGGLGLEDEDSRSPAPSPRRHIKRPRPILDIESDTVSQQSQSQSKSQGEPGTCSKAASGLPGKPPMHPNKGQRRKTVEPPVLRNPYLTPAGSDSHVYHTTSHATSFKEHRLFWDFKQEEKLGSGNFSEVYCVAHRMSGKRYALKKSRRPVATITDKNMWLAEVQALAAVEGHPNVVTFYDSWVEPAEPAGSGEWFFIRLELCGHSLGSSVSGSGSAGSSAHAGGKTGSRHAPREPMKEAELQEVLRQMASALKHIHDLGLAHLDLKPDNIYRSRPQLQPFQSLQQQPSLNTASSLTSTLSSQLNMSQGTCSAPPPPPVVYKLGDFGLATAKSAPAPLTEGDARYLAPELLAGRCEAGLDKADLFALGATLYELATGCALPTGGERYHALRAGQLMMMPCVSVKLQQLIKKLMSADPRERPTADQLLRSSVLAPKSVTHHSL